MLPIKTILHPTDFSDHSDYALALACSLARDYNARLIVLHVLERLPQIYSGVMTPTPPILPPDGDRKAAWEDLQRIQAPDNAVPIERLLDEGNPAGAIIQVAEEQPCQLIVLGTHGRTGLRRLLMGSVAEQVVRDAPCPVLTVKTPEGSAATREPIAAAASRETA
jgi:nucleotide-binding universal stress UspA family protein